MMISALLHWSITAVDGNGYDSYTLPANTASVSGNNLTVDPDPA